MSVPVGVRVRLVTVMIIVRVTVVCAVSMTVWCAVICSQMRAPQSKKHRTLSRLGKPKL